MNSLRTTVLCLSFLAVQALAEAPRPVGELGVPDRLVLAGNRSFSREAIADALGGDVDVLQAAHPHAPLDGYTSLLRAKLLMGYLRNGFSRTKVSVSIDDTSKVVKVTVTEGPRFVNGGVKVVGARAVSEAELQKLLTSKGAPGTATAASAVWEAGAPTKFDRLSTERLAEQVRTAYTHFGRFFPDVGVKVVPQRDGKTAVLTIVVRAEGPKAVVGRIEVTGLKVNLPEDVVEYLGLRVGMSLDGAAMAAMEKKLWESGRFLDSGITPEREDEVSGEVRLRIHVREFEKAPPLKEELSASDKAMLRLRRHLSGFATGDMDAVLTIGQQGATTELVLSPEHGVLARIRDERAKRDEVLLYGAKRLGFYTMADRTGVESTHSGSISATLALKANPEKDAEQPFVFQFHLSASTKSADEAGQAAFRANVTLEPVAFLGLARREGLAVSRKNGETVLKGANFLLRVREATGEVVELSVPDALMGMSIRAEFVPGRFEAYSKELAALPAGAVRQASATEVLAHFITRSGPRQLLFARGTAEQQERVARAIARLARGTATPLAGGLASHAEEGERFALPVAAGAGGMMQALAQVAIPTAQRLFPKGSWPVVLVREAALVVCGRSRYTTLVLQDLYRSEDTGPVGYLATAWLLGYANRDMARVFARKGLEELSVGAFRKDARILLSDEGVVGKALVGLRRSALELDEEDLEALDAVLAPAYGKVVVSFLRNVRREQADDDLQAGVGKALDAWWNESLRAQVARALQTIVESK